MIIKIIQQKEDKNVEVFSMVFTQELASLDFIKELITLTEKYKINGSV